MADDVEESVDPSAVYCRHCGEPAKDGTKWNTDWLCVYCQRYQDSMACPTCHSTVRISLMSEDVVPAPHAPLRRRR